MRSLDTKRTLAWAGVVVGLVAAFVALPPLEVRTPVASVVIGPGWGFRG